MRLSPPLQLTRSEEASAAVVIGALDSPLRIRIVLLLADRDHYVHEIVKVTAKSQPLISQHLRVLKNAGLVDSERRGREVVYRLCQPRALEIISCALVAANSSRLEQRAMATVTQFPRGHRKTKVTDSPTSGVPAVACTDEESDGHRSSAAAGPAYAPAAVVTAPADPPTIPPPVIRPGIDSTPLTPN